ncbi:MAG: hypothetical protein GXO10_01325 [Crenarchaeota archaeon]|nr:hypothetical protein [Thermoproteota archaeon]
MIVAYYAIASNRVETSLLSNIGILLEKYSAILDGSQFLMEGISGPKFQDIEPIVVTGKNKIVVFKVFIDIMDSNTLLRKMANDSAAGIVAQFSRWLLSNGIIIKHLYKTGFNVVSKLLHQTETTGKNLLGKLVAGKINYVIVTKQELVDSAIASSPQALIKLMRMGWKRIVITDDSASMLYLYFADFRGRCIPIPYNALQRIGQSLKMGYGELGRLKAEYTPSMPIDHLLNQ